MPRDARQPGRKAKKQFGKRAAVAAAEEAMLELAMHAKRGRNVRHVHT